MRKHKTCLLFILLTAIIVSTGLSGCSKGNEVDKYNDYTLGGCSYKAPATLIEKKNEEEQNSSLEAPMQIFEMQPRSARLVVSYIETSGDSVDDEDFRTWFKESEEDVYSDKDYRFGGESQITFGPGIHGYLIKYSYIDPLTTNYLKQSGDSDASIRAYVKTVCFDYQDNVYYFKFTTFEGIKDASENTYDELFRGILDSVELE